jgi:DNA invertase Pin-like site-specific DNA recombinase
MEKVILFARVSTQDQEYERQLETLQEMAYADGYTDENQWIPIGVKESGLKLDDKEREGLKLLDEAINSPDFTVKCVYTWQLSRLSRRPKTLSDIIYDFAARNINFKTQQEDFVWLDGENNIIPKSEERLHWHISQVKADSLTRIESTSGGKKRNARLGNFNGGKSLKYGYMCEPNGKHKKIVLHPEQSEIVKEVFNLYRTGDYGIVKVYKELKSKGRDIKFGMIEHILLSEAYTGITMPGDKS